MRINTINTKKDQLENGFFTLGAGPEKLLLMGSCRVVPYLNYFDYLTHNNRFTVYFIDPVNWCWDALDHRIDFEQKMKALESDSRILDLIKSCRWFIHEYYQNYGMFNTDRSNPKNIYQFGMTAEYDITLPNFHDKFILFKDILTFDAALRAQAIADLAKSRCLSADVQTKVKAMGLGCVEKFYGICPLTSLPEMADIFRTQWQIVRFFHNMNHVSNWFTIAIFRLLNEKFLHLDVPASFWERVKAEDMYATPHTPITEYDVCNYDLKWPEPVQALNLQ